MNILKKGRAHVADEAVGAAQGRVDASADTDQTARHRIGQIVGLRIAAQQQQEGILVRTAVTR